jgi:hypothetical protein
MNSKWGQEKVFSTIFIEISKNIRFYLLCFLLITIKHLRSIPLQIKNYTMIMQKYSFENL